MIDSDKKGHDPHVVNSVLACRRFSPAVGLVKASACTSNIAFAAFIIRMHMPCAHGCERRPLSTLSPLSSDTMEKTPSLAATHRHLFRL